MSLTHSPPTTDYTYTSLGNGMHQGVCGHCGRTKVTANAGMLAGWFGAHQGADPTFTPDCPALKAVAA